MLVTSHRRKTSFAQRRKPDVVPSSPRLTRCCVPYPVQSTNNLTHNYLFLQTRTCRKHCNTTSQWAGKDSVGCRSQDWYKSRMCTLTPARHTFRTARSCTSVVTMQGAASPTLWHALRARRNRWNCTSMWVAAKYDLKSVVRPLLLLCITAHWLTVYRVFV